MNCPQALQHAVNLVETTPSSTVDQIMLLHLSLHQICQDAARINSDAMIALRTFPNFSLKLEIEALYDRFRTALQVSSPARLDFGMCCISSPLLSLTRCRFFAPSPNIR